MLPSPTPAAYAAYQSIRSVQPPESPFAGMLARAPGGRTVLLVDRDEVADWAGWGAEGEAHLLTPLDVVRREDGHDVALPALTERLDRFLTRRADAGAPLSPGEAVTLAVSIVRGLAASLRRGPEEAGEWWLGDDGKPTLVEGIGDSHATRASADVLSALAESVPRTRLAAVLASLAGACEERGFTREALDWEERVFALAAPEPLVTEILGPLRARAVSAAPADPSILADLTPRRGWWERLLSHVDADLAEAASDALTGALRRVRSRAPGRRRPWLWAAGIALVVVIGGLLLPSGTDAPIASSDRAPLATPSLSTAPSATTPPETTPPVAEGAGVPPAVSDDPAVIAATLLDARNQCTDAACAAGVLEDPARAVPSGVVDAAPEGRRVSLVDDLGALVVVRVESTDASLPLQLVTIVESTNGWRIRDVYDVTDAPS